MSIELSIRLKRLRKLKRWTQLDLSKQSGVKRSTIAKIENCTTLHPEQRTGQALAKALGVSTHFFYFGAHDDEPEINEIVSIMKNMTEEKRADIMKVIRALS